MPFRYLENITRADVAFEATGNSLEELFTSCVDAMMSVMVGDLEAISPSEVRNETLHADSLPELLHDFLQRIVYHKDANLLLLRVSKISIHGHYEVSAEFRGEELNPEKHELVTDVKAVTHHHFQLKSLSGDPGKWVATAVLDV